MAQLPLHHLESKFLFKNSFALLYTFFKSTQPASTNISTRHVTRRVVEGNDDLNGPKRRVWRHLGHK